MQIHEMLELIAYAQMPIMNAHADEYSKVRGLRFGLSLHKHPYFVFVSSEGSGQSAHMRRFV